MLSHYTLRVVGFTRLPVILSKIHKKVPLGFGTMSITTPGQWFEAVHQRNYMLVERYADRFASSVNSHGETALMLATRAQDVQMMELLVGYERGMFNKMGETALVIAIDNNLFMGIELLARNEATSTGYDGSSPLHHVVRSNKIDFVPYLAPLLAEKRDDAGRTPLELAAELGYTEMMERLIRHGLPVATADQINRAAQIAEEHGFPDCAYAIRNTSAPPTDPQGGRQIFSGTGHIYENARSDQYYNDVTANQLHAHSARITAPLVPPELGPEHIESAGREHSMSPYAIYNTNCPNCEKNITALVSLLIDRDQTVAELRHRLDVAQNDNVILKKKIRALEELQEQHYQGSLEHAMAIERENNPDRYVGTNNAVDGSLSQTESQTGFGHSATTTPSRQLANSRLGSTTGNTMTPTTGGFTERHLKCLSPSQRQHVIEDTATIELATDYKTLRAMGIDISNAVPGTTKLSNSFAAETLKKSLSNSGRVRSAPSETVLNCEPGSAMYSTHISRRYGDSPSRSTSRTRTALSGSQTRAGSNTLRRSGSVTGTNKISGATSTSRPQSRTQSRTGRSGSTVDRQRHMPPSKTNAMDETELMLAALNGDLMLVDQLRHTQVGYVNKFGKTALMYAAERNHVSCVTLLFLKESGKQDRDGMSALMYAAQYGYMTVCKTLMYAEAKLTRHDGMTALMLAASNGHELVVSILLEFEAGYQNLEGMTALILAAQNGHLECCKLLCSQEIFMTDNEGHDAVWHAREYGRQAIAIELKHYKDCFSK